jgi:hypothetical protein
VGNSLANYLQHKATSWNVGIFWWEPAVSSGPLRSRGFFDDDGNALPVIRVFDRALRPARPEPGRGRE